MTGVCGVSAVVKAVYVLAVAGLAVAAMLSVSAAAVLAKEQQYLPSWQSLDSRPVPGWFEDAKFGIFIHFGVYSVPSWAPVGTYAEWYWWQLSNTNSSTYAVRARRGIRARQRTRRLRTVSVQFHVKTYGPDFVYPDFAPLFRAELFDPAFWAYLFRASGARYVVPTSKHHEGFTMWPSPQAWNWNAVDVGPHRDLLGDLMQAVRAEGLRAGLYYSLFEWFNTLYRGPTPHIYVEQVMLPQVRSAAQ
jgi:alpha-L-fucosidase